MKTKSKYKQFNDKYFILDSDNPFITNSIDDEILANFNGINTNGLKDEIFKTIETFDFSNFNYKKKLSNFSGGEKVIICFSIFYSLAIRKIDSNTNLLLINVLESLSPNNRFILVKKLQILKEKKNITSYKLNNNNPVRIEYE